MSTPLHEKVAVVIGGTGGIGRVTAKRLAAAGAHVVVVNRADTAAAQRLADTLHGTQHLGASAQLTDSASLVALAKKVEETYGRADILINTGGFTQAIKHSDLDALTDELIDDIMQVNFRGQFAAIRAFRHLLEASGDGLVVNVSSIAGSTGVGSNIAYCAAKAALDVMTVSLGRALAPRIRVLNVAPGAVDTPFVPGRGADFNQKVAATTPLGRVGLPEDVAAAIEACATHLTFSTGTTIIIDGGRRL